MVDNLVEMRVHKLQVSKSVRRGMLHETDRTTTLVLVPHGLQPRLLRICVRFTCGELYYALYVWYACGYELPVGGPRSARGTEVAP